MSEDQKSLLRVLGLSIFNITDKDLSRLMSIIDEELSARQRVHNLEMELNLARKVYSSRVASFDYKPMWRVTVEPNSTVFHPQPKSEDTFDPELGITGN